MLSMILRASEIANGDIITGEIGGRDGVVTEYGESNRRLAQGWVVGGNYITNNKTNRKVLFYRSNSIRYAVLRPTNDEPTEWGEAAL